MKIALGADHAGYELKGQVAAVLEEHGHEVLNYGTNEASSVDYPDYGHPVAGAILEGAADLGVVICGSGNGINMTVNKHAGIRSALCWNEELAALARQHNDANMLALPARFITEKEALAITRRFLEAEFEGGRHARRVAKIAPQEKSS
ncbi:MAG: ribose 5-phosphate isomerase B [Schleiferiaceae bacterium]|jgi:ribose 5-phosphate isomerase B|nr:ribose 5-phosphate isomerase B [Schleiferiaceae bacterium]MDR9441858.1 ribose 5-phosphate isomerase B [Schleiferiaceae bacterium]